MSEDLISSIFPVNCHAQNNSAEEKLRPGFSEVVWAPYPFNHMWHMSILPATSDRDREGGILTEGKGEYPVYFWLYVATYCIHVFMGCLLVAEGIRKPLFRHLDLGNVYTLRSVAKGA